jgi:phage terminase large subunit-like protein
LDRYITDLAEGDTTHDDCAITRTHALNARKLAKPGDKYILGKPSEHQKIDALMADVLANEAAADATADGWADVAGPAYFRLPR